MSTKDILQRYLTARADVDENAGVLAACIKNDNKPIDAVEIESKDLNLANRLLEYSDLTYSLLNINNHFILLSKRTT